MVLILFPASRSLPFFFFFFNFSHPIPPSNVRFHRESKWANASKSRHPLPLAALPHCLRKSPTLGGLGPGQSLRLRFWEWELAGENTSFLGYTGERLGGRPRGRRDGRLSPGPLGQGPGLACTPSYLYCASEGFSLVSREGSLSTMFIRWGAQSAGWAVFLRNCQRARGVVPI